MRRQAEELARVPVFMIPGCLAAIFLRALVFRIAHRFWMPSVESQAGDFTFDHDRFLEWANLERQYFADSGVRLTSVAGYGSDPRFVGWDRFAPHHPAVRQH